MKDKLKSAAKAPAKAARAKKGAAKAKRPAAKKTKATGTRSGKAPANPTKPVKPELAAKRAAKAASTAKKPIAKSEKAPAKPKKRKAALEQEAQYRIGELALDPIGDTTDGEGRTYTGEVETYAEQSNPEVEAFRKETQIEASDVLLEAGPGMAAAVEAIEGRARSEAVETAAADAEESREEEEPGPELHEPANLERLQKILSQAGIASRRRAEEMITAGRVMVNGEVVTALGSKADPAHDHIRVDGKLLHGAERHRYFVLNKPKGYVTTVSDPEGRPTVMQFFEKMRERLYPVGRLDYQSEGLLMMTNDGELANLLTKAGSGVEKTYLVKVAGQPTEQELERLRSGVEIERGESGSGRVRTAPARVRQVREGDNPWFEVVLIEGRNRELRKMFAAVGHYVEKIRRVGYGPLVLDVEPGNLRELSANEVAALRLAAEGKLRPRQLKADRMLPKDAGRAAEDRESAKRPRRDVGRGPGNKDFGARGRRDFGRRENRGFEKREGGGFAGRDKKPFQPRGEREQKREWKPRDGEFRGRHEGGEFRRGEKGGFGARRQGGEFQRGEKREFGTRREFGEKRGGERAGFGRREGRPFGGPKPGFERQGFGAGPRGERGERNFERGPQKPFRERGERPYFKRGSGPQGQREEGPGRSFERDPQKSGGQKPYGRGSDRPNREGRGPRQAAPEFRGQGRKFGDGKAKPTFGGRPGGFRGGPRRESGGRTGGGRRFGGQKRS
jgi:23S rRNA pseudouridine2605 synthase